MTTDRATPPSQQSRLISKALSPAVRLWLRSQVESVEHLTLEIAGSDRQILAGYLPKVAIAASQALYQGIHLGQIALSAQEIRINLGQVLKGKPLQLLAVVPVTGEICLTEADLNASLSAPLLATALRDLLLPLLRASLTPQSQKDNPLTDVQVLQVAVEGDRLILTGSCIAKPPIPFQLRTGLQVLRGNRLRFAQPEWLLPSGKGQPLDAFQAFEADLGSEVDLQELTIANQQILCQGQINIIPA